MTSVLAGLIGLAAGVASGAFGIGGALLTTPGIRLGLNVPAHIAIGTTLPVIIPGALMGLRTYARRHLVDYRLAGFAAGAGVVFSVAGAAVSELVNGRVLLIVTAGLMAILAVRMLRRKTAPQNQPSRRHWALFLAVGAASGFVSGLLGLGGGIILVPLFTGLLGLPIKTAVGTSLAVVAAQAVPGTIVHAQLGNVDWIIAAGLMVGGVPGAIIGSHLAVAASDHRLKLAFAIGMGALALIFGATELSSLAS